MSFISFIFFIERVLFYRKIDVKSFKNKKALDIALTKHLTIIGTIASNSPYIGLLETVLAIMLYIYYYGKWWYRCSKIMSSLALALKATAVGLVVAIISMIFYNILNRFAEVLESEYETTEVWFNKCNTFYWCFIGTFSNSFIDFNFITKRYYSYCLPNASNADTLKPNKEVVIVIKEDGTIICDDNIQGLENIKEHLLKFSKDNPVHINMIKYKIWCFCICFRYVKKHEYTNISIVTKKW